MRAYKTHLTVKDPKRVVLTDLPFRAGQRIEVLILRADSSDNAVRDFEPLLKETQSLPQAQAISEADIALPSSVPQDAEVPPNIEAKQIISCLSAVLSD